MRNGTVNRVAFASDYLPRKCGIATFTHDLRNALAAEYPKTDFPVAAVNDIDDGYAYPSEVRFEWPERDIDSYRRAADFINFSNSDCVSLQHEFGIFGGTAGSHVLSLVHDLATPVVTTLHTVLAEPNQEQRKVLDALIEELGTALPDPGQLAAQQAGFALWYRSAAFDAWREFAGDFPRGAQRLHGPAEWQQAAAKMASDQGPYFALLHRMAQELEPLAAAGALPVVDCDCMGRALSWLDQTTYDVAGISIAPFVCTDSYGRSVLYEDIRGRTAERFIRAAASRESSGGIV